MEERINPSQETKRNLANLMEAAKKKKKPMNYEKFMKKTKKKMEKIIER